MKTVVFACIISITCGAAGAQDYVQFRTVDSNIHCLMDTGAFSGVRCDIYDFTPTFTIAPPDCDLDWEGSFYIAEDALTGELGCVGDTIEAPTAPLIADGETISTGKFSCVANGVELTCVNLKGHGFRLSREKQTLF